MEQIIRQLQDMTYLSWAKARNSSGTAGSFLKAKNVGDDPQWHLVKPKKQT